MVAGLELFKERFVAYANSYVLIGGAACYVHEEASAQLICVHGKSKEAMWTRMI